MLLAARTAFRLTRAGLHIAWGAGVAALALPLVGNAVRLQLRQRWSRQLLEILGVRLETASWARPLSGLLVANHISWLDIFVINAVAPAAFVCKAEVRAWPLIGWLCASSDTIFMERGSRSAARRTNDALIHRLRGGELAAFFPEGTTGEGRTPLPFRNALFQAAINAESVIQPVALRYLDEAGRHSAAAAYCGSTTLWQSLRNIAAAAGLRVRMEILVPLAARGMTRHELSETARRLIGHALSQPVAPHLGRETGDYPGERQARVPA